MARIREIIIRNRTTGVNTVHYECSACEAVARLTDLSCWKCGFPFQGGGNNGNILR